MSNIWLISGSRDFLGEKLAKHILGFYLVYKDLVIHGGAKGVDTWANEIATDRGCVLHIMLAEWDKYGKAAGPLRNRDMLKFAQDHSLLTEQPLRALIFWDGISKGTKSMLDLVESKGVPYTLIKEFK